MIVWRVSNYNRETDQQPWIKYYRTRRKRWQSTSGSFRSAVGMTTKM
jgi:hypothetical protein